MVMEYSNGHHHDNADMLTTGSDALPGSPNGEFQGDVRLRVEATDSVQMVISFVDTLRQKHHVRILELSGTVAGGVDIRLVLREPIDFISALRQIEGVSKVEGPEGQGEGGGEPLVHVQLAEDA